MYISKTNQFLNKEEQQFFAEATSFDLSISLDCKALWSHEVQTLEDALQLGQRAADYFRRDCLVHAIRKKKYLLVMQFHPLSAWYRPNQSYIQHQVPGIIRAKVLPR